MFVAIDENKNKVSIESTEPGKHYYCPICREELIIKAKDSIAVKAHFAHKKGTDCDDFSHDMSEWHLNWQNKFPIENREVVIEKDGIKHRADVFIDNTVIEFQHSPITAEEIAKRNEFYLSCGYKVIWIFDAENQIKNEYGDSIDPSMCMYGGLCWKRPKRQFSNKMSQDVQVFLQYKAMLSDSPIKGQIEDVLILLDNVEPKEIHFFKTQISDGVYVNLRPDFFLKDFGLNQNPYSFPLSTIKSMAKLYWEIVANRPRVKIMRVQNNTRYFPRYRKSIRF